MILRGLILAVGRMAMDRVAIYIYGKEMEVFVKQIRSDWMGLYQIQIMSTFSLSFLCMMMVILRPISFFSGRPGTLSIQTSRQAARNHFYRCRGIKDGGGAFDQHECVFPVYKPCHTALRDGGLIHV